MRSLPKESVGNIRWYHLAAIGTVAIWGTTFVSTKILLLHGLTPAEIMFYRFLIAYVVIWFLIPRPLKARNFRDELLLAAAGVCGGSLYFLTENSALQFTLVTNVSLIICTTPLLTALLARLLNRNERLKPEQTAGSLLAFGGVALVVFNGSFILRINPAGDLLVLWAALSWASYTLLVRRLEKHYSAPFITRKVFFYGLLTLSPAFCFTPFRLQTVLSSSPLVWGNLLFLGLVASLGCFLMWNIVVKHLGPVKANNYIYTTPLVALMTSVLVLDEPLTGIALCGAGLILCGVWLAEKGLPFGRGKLLSPIRIRQENDRI